MTMWTDLQLKMYGLRFANSKIVILKSEIVIHNDMAYPVRLALLHS